MDCVLKKKNPRDDLLPLEPNTGDLVARACGFCMDTRAREKSEVANLSEINHNRFLLSFFPQRRNPTRRRSQGSDVLDVPFALLTAGGSILGDLSFRDADRRDVTDFSDFSARRHQEAPSPQHAPEGLPLHFGAGANALAKPANVPPDEIQWRFAGSADNGQAQRRFSIRLRVGDVPK